MSHVRRMYDNADVIARCTSWSGVRVEVTEKGVFVHESMKATHTLPPSSIESIAIQRSDADASTWKGRDCRVEWDADGPVSELEATLLEDGWLRTYPGGEGSQTMQDHPPAAYEHIIWGSDYEHTDD